MALNSWVLAARWVRAVYHFGFEAETWNLLRPVELMAYSLAASQDLIHSLNTKDRRRMEMRGTTRMVLREHPFSFLNAVIPQRVGSEAYSYTSVDEYKQKAEEAIGPGISVRERREDVEKGESPIEGTVDSNEENRGGHENAN